MIKTLTLIGSGKMAQALAMGLAKSYRVELVARDKQKLQKIKDQCSDIKIQTLNDSFDIDKRDILLCIKPNALKSVSKKFQGVANSIISILAGTKLEELKKHIKAKHYVRAMPNLAATYQKSMTSLSGDESFKDEAIKISQSFGKSIWLSSEKEIDIATAIAGSGPAFLALVAEAMADGGVKEGLKREDAVSLVLGVFESFIPLLSNTHPAIIKDEVMSPAGTTAAGFCALEESKARDAFIKAISKAYQKASGRG